MSILSPLKEVFVKAAGTKTGQIMIENAAKISGGIYAAQDLLFTTGGFFIYGLTVPTKPEEYLPIVTSLYFMEGMSLLGADKFPILKKPAGFFGMAGSLTMLAAGVEPNAALLLGTGVPPLITGLTMMFEEKVNSVATKVSQWPGILGGAAGVFAKYPTATTAMIQNIAPAFLMGYANQSDNPYIGLYAGAWAVANCFLALTDDNLKAELQKHFPKADMALPVPANDASLGSLNHARMPINFEIANVASDNLFYTDGKSIAHTSGIASPWNKLNDAIIGARQSFGQWAVENMPHSISYKDMNVAATHRGYLPTAAIA